MTTIAWKGNLLAGDRKTSDGTYTWETTKVWRVGHSSYIGSCGDTSDCLAVKEWVHAGMPPDKKPSVDNYYGLFIVDGAPFFLDSKLIPMPIGGREYYAIGSGRDFALAAMRLGKSPEEAVLLAAEFDPNTGFGVDVVEVEE